MGDQAGDIGDRGIVSRLERGIDGGKTKGPGIQAAARAGNRSHGEEVGSHIGVLVRGGVGGAVVEDGAIVDAGLQRVLSLDPGYIVHRVVGWDVDDTGRIRSAKVAGAKRVHVAEGHVVLIGGAPVRIALPNKPVAHVVYDRVRDGPHVAGGNSLGIV